MKLHAILLSVACLTVSAQPPETPRHFLGTARPLTSPSPAPPETIARGYLESLSADLALTRAGLDSVYVAKQYLTAHNGVTNIIFRQRFQGAEVLNSEWVVNIDRQGRVLNAGGRLVNGPAGALVPSMPRALAAVRSAVKAVNPHLEGGFAPFESAQPPRARNGIRFDRGPLPRDVDGAPVWYAQAGELRPAWNFFVAHTDQVHRYSVTVDDGTQAILDQQPLTLFEAPAPASTPGGMVFEGDSPQPNPTPGVRLSGAPPMASRTLQSFQGDPTASPLTWTNGTETAGNNVIAGENLLGSGFIRPIPTPVANGNFAFPLQLGPGTNPLDYRDAATTNLFYWMNRAHDLHYQYGFDEPSGNFQADNLGRGGVGGDAIFAYSHYGAQALTAGSIENAFFSVEGSTDDGVQAEVSMFVSAAVGALGDFFTDGSYDAQVMVHEYTHGVSERLARQVYTTFQGASMGEAWSDFYALEYTVPDGAPPDGLYPIGQYFDQSWGYGGARTRPYSTNMDLNPLTFANLGHVRSAPEVHSDGEIWFECMWEMRANLIRQFGETEGRKRVRQLVMDGMKLAIPAASMVDMRDAILLADRVDYQGASQSGIWAAFAKRGMGALAYSDGGTTTHIVASFDLPSAGALKFYDDPIVAGEPLRMVFQSSSYSQPTIAIQLTTSSGDSERLVLHQRGEVYVGSMSTGVSAVSSGNAFLEIVPGDSITASPADATMAAKVVASTMLPYALSATTNSFTFPNETRNSLTGTSLRVQLPFEFPYFDQHYGAALVYRNGLVAFDTPVTTSSCTDSVGLRKYIAVAPLWTSLSLSGTAQENEGLYISRASDSITFRWAGEYVAIGESPTPVNFAATLFSDGRVQFNYGSGNAVQAPYTTLQCGVPATGVSNGHDTYSSTLVLASYDKALTFRFDPPFHGTSSPSVRLQSPQDGQHVQDILIVSGGATDTGAFVRSVDVFIDGVERSRLLTSGVGGTFSAPLNLAGMGLLPGDHSLMVRVVNARGATTDFPSPALKFTMDPGQAFLPVVAIEKPLDSANVSGVLAVSGYAYNADLRITNVDTLIDGVVYGATLYGNARSDVCTTLSPAPPNCPAVGFSGSFPTVEGFPPIPDGPHKLQVRIRDQTGRFTMYPDSPITINVKNGAIPKIVGVLESPATNATLSGVITVSGYAYSPGHRIISGTLLVDGISYSSVTLAQPRPDVCPSLPDANACPAIGFTGTFDTTRLLDGPHIIGIRVLNELGDSLTFPGLVNGGTNIFTKN